MINSVLIANRGEIAVRLIRGYRELGVRTIAVYSDADADAWHVALADTAIAVGPAPVTESYLNIAAIIAAAQVAGADAIDPGYGLLSENASFAAAVLEAGLIFIGPAPATVAQMGDKVAARQAAMQAGVPVVPGSKGVVTSTEQALKAAELIGFPLLVKTSFGGGGRGMRAVIEPEALADALAQAAQEAQSAFGRSEVYLERQIAGARHVEVQILADEHGTVLHLGDRDCSVQRRHQKLIEEAPAPFLNDAVRERIRHSAVELSRSVGYRSTGTVEYLYDPGTGEFFFLEMNTRLQVEHGVTELVTGIDLVAARLAVARGEKLGFSQADVAVRGHSIEVRLAAEQPWLNFMPSPGHISSLHSPAGPWLRADFGVAAGSDVPREYDSMFGKLMAWGPDRETARLRLIAALEELEIVGISTTAPYVRQVLGDEAFVAGQYSTTSTETVWSPLRWPAPLAQISAAPVATTVEPGPSRVVDIHTNAGDVHVAIYGRAHGRAAAVAAPSRSDASGDGRTTTARQPIAPMDGLVIEVAVKPGQQVQVDDVLVVVEAMKMQMPVTAPRAGVVGEVLVERGETVNSGQLTVRFEDVPVS